MFYLQIREIGGNSHFATSHYNQSVEGRNDAFYSPNRGKDADKVLKTKE